jgi:putative hydrolase of the HAD superfamily
MIDRLKLIIFDWGDTVMRDIPGFKGPMAFWPKVEAIDGVTEALEAIHRKYTCCLASNADDSDAESMGQALARVDIKKYFQNLFTSKDLGTKKPDPDFYRKILKNLNVKPGACAAVGNDYAKDILPAAGLGIKTVWLSRDNTPDNKADVVIKSMKELPSALEAL